MILIFSFFSPLLFAISGQNGNVLPKKASPKVKLTHNLAKDGRLAERKGLPILLVFSASDCSYCELLEAEILRPMLLSGDYTDKVIIRKVNIDEDSAIVRDFNGKKTPLNDIVLRYGVYVTPTVIFVNHEGTELAKRLIGINTVEYYGGDVDAAIEKSLKKIRNSDPLENARK